MLDHEDLTQRLLGDIGPGPLDLLAPQTPRWREWLEKLREPVTWGWLLVIVRALVLPIILLR